jgi:RNA polymerase sigma factor (sigma-70 family)
MRLKQAANVETRAKQIDEGFVALVNRHRPMLERVCRIYEDGAEERKDLFQEIVYQLCRSYATFRGEAHVKTWMYRVALNTAITAFRQRTARPEHVELEEEVSPGPKEGGKVETEERGRMEILYGAIRSLNKVDRAVVTLYLEGFEYREIAETLGLTETNVGVKLNRIKTKLQERVRGQQ